MAEAVRLRSAAAPTPWRVSTLPGADGCWVNDADGGLVETFYGPEGARNAAWIVHLTNEVLPLTERLLADGGAVEQLVEAVRWTEQNLRAVVRGEAIADMVHNEAHNRAAIEAVGYR